MSSDIPTAEKVRASLHGMGYPQLEALAERSGVPFHTLLKIRDGVTKNPGLDTVVKFWPHLDSKAAA